MNLLFFIIFGLLIFLSSLLGGKKYRSTALYALAIGGVVNANFFHAVNYPIDCFGLPFGIDSIIYTLFVYCVIVMFIQNGKKDAYLLAFSSIIAILFSALMELIANILSNGFATEFLIPFLNFLISSIASLIAIYAMIELLHLLKGKVNQYLLLLIGIIIATIIDTIIYYPLVTLINGTPNNILILVLTSIIGKLIATLCAIFSLWLLNVYDKKHYNKRTY